jgi:hypothetical protein
MLKDQHHLETHGNANELKLIPCKSRLYEISLLEPWRDKGGFHEH